ncbi:DUF2795 domain-containing protein [Sphaerisporangium fuscum]|uniref:DUF2795 domain-containing protein n=1 Tax=Sphaerisporangium fuscum TaxID=2835868 RepID=UPI001BDD74FB|nr:DUF2795 domain-containing protein [Sphaerisporangium fuscum]
MPQADFIRVQKYLSGVDYPAGKDELLDHAKKQGADQEAIEALNRLPDKTYDGPNAVSQAVAKT